MGILVEKIKVINTKKGEKMAFIDISDDTGSASAVIFPNSNALIGTFDIDDLIVIKANIGKRNDEIQIVINELVNEN
jgi:DNA polymerase-3 subunit alpha